MYSVAHQERGPSLPRERWSPPPLTCASTAGFHQGSISITWLRPGATAQGVGHRF